jgi:glucokinase
MEILGLDIAPRCITGVVVDDTGAVLRRARCDGDSTASIDEVVAELQFAGTVVGVAGETAAPVAKRATRSAPGAAAVAGEAWRGAASGAQHAICLWIGDRVLAGILLNGAPWLGAHGLAGAAGWLAINPVERQDYRKFGSLAAEVSDKGIARRLSWRIQAGDNSAVLERAGDLESITAAHVFDGARNGDGVATSVVRDTARYVGMAAANLVAAFDPEVIVLGGPMARAGDLLLEPSRQECLRRLPTAMADRLRFDVSPLAGDGIAIGAAALAVSASRA